MRIVRTGVVGRTLPYYLRTLGTTTIMKQQKLSTMKKGAPQKRWREDEKESGAQKKGAPEFKRREDRTLIFEDRPDFRPSLLPQEVLAQGAFGGAYFRPIESGVTGLRHAGAEAEFAALFAGIDKALICSPKANVKRNKYGVKSGTELAAWEGSGWIKKQDPYGWFQWYCRFVMGRRSEDDERQIQRWKNFTGPKGRFKLNLIGKIKKAETTFDDASISPVIRQGLLHWGYELTAADCE
jgi:hypothetical protein